MRNGSVPRNGSNVRAFMVVRHARLELCWLLYVLTDIKNENFLSSSSKKVLLEGGKCYTVGASARMDLGNGDATFAKFEGVGVHVLGFELQGVPKSDSSVVLSSSDESHLVAVLSPVKRCELGGADSHTHLL